MHIQTDGIKEIDLRKCVKCGACYDACPSLYDAVSKVSPSLKKVRNLISLDTLTKAVYY